jgi:catalase
VLLENTARAMGDAPEFIKRRHVGNCSKADPAHGAGVAKVLGLNDGGRGMTDKESGQAGAG